MNAIDPHLMGRREEEDDEQNARPPKWNGIERRSEPPPSGFALNSWSAIQSLLMVAIMLLGGIAWGLKLESRIDAVEGRNELSRKEIETDVSNLQTVISRGVLPVTDVRLNAAELSIKELSRQVDYCLDRNSRTEKTQ